MYVFGVDPGPLPGIVRLHLVPAGAAALTTRLASAEAVQSTPGALTAVLDGLAAGSSRTALALERYVVGSRAARSAAAAAGSATRGMVGVVEAWGNVHCYRVHLRCAADVKPWATDERLHALGLIDLTKGMRHARDAGRHALFAAVRDYGLPDPLSRRGGAR